MNGIVSAAALASYLLAPMKEFTPVEKHSYYEATSVTEARYERVAKTIADALAGKDMPEDEKVKLGLVMVSIGDAESNWNTAIVDCKRGDATGRAWGPWQTELPKAKVCESLTAAFELALGMVQTSFLMCKHLPLSERLSWYTDGGAWNSTPAHRKRAAQRSSWRMYRALSWLKTHPFTVTFEAP